MTDHDELGTRLGAALRQRDEAQPVDVRAARAVLVRRLGSPQRGWIRPVAVTVAVVVAAVVGVTGLTRLDRDHAPVPAQGVTLPSGLPTGVLSGQVVHRHQSAAIVVPVGLVARADGTGSILLPDVGGRYEDARFVGTEAGHVVVYGDSPLCSGRPELLLDFTVNGATVTITRATAGGCTVTDVAAAELVGARLTLHGAAG